MKRVLIFGAYPFLFPGLGLFYFCVMWIGGINVPLPGGSYWELEDLRPWGGPSLANIIEIPIAASWGLIGAIILLACQSRAMLKTGRSVVIFVSCWYGAAVMFYLMMPTLPE